MKQCTCCKKNKLLHDFHKHKGKKDGHRSICKECFKADFKKRSQDPDFKIARKLKQRERRKNPDFKIKEKVWYRKVNFRRKYGITIEKYNELFSNQSGCCAICGSHQSQRKRRLAVDHCHKTKKIRSLLCDYCNPGLGYFRDSKELLSAAISYLKRHE